MQFRKKPIIVDAVQWTGSNLDECIQFISGEEMTDRDRVMTSHLVIRTIEGDMQCAKGDWIIRGTKGEIYPCKPDIFADVYEAV